jgi:tetratricopeptide (TPR) repeat protein
MKASFSSFSVIALLVALNACLSPARATDPAAPVTPTTFRNNRADKLGIPDPLTAIKPALPPNARKIKLSQEVSNDPIEKGKDLAYKGHYDQAIAVLSKAIDKNPGLAKAYTVRAFAYEGKGKHAEAIADATKAISIDPSDPEAYGTRMRAYGASHQMEAGAVDERMVLQIHEQRLMKGADNYLGRCNDKIKRAPNFSSNYVERASAYRGLHQFQKALDDYNVAIKRDPHNYLAYYNRAQVYLQMNKHDLADHDFALAQQLVNQQKGKSTVRPIR